MSIKKLIALTIAMVMLLTVPLVTVSAADPPTIKVSTASGVVGDEVALSISIENNPGIVTMFLDLHYDASKLELTNVASTGLLAGTTVTFGNSYAANPFKMNWDGSLLSGNSTANGVIATVKFKIKEGATGAAVVRVDYTPNNIYDYNFGNVDFAISNGGISLENPQTDAEAVAEAKAALTWDVIRNANTTQTAVTTSLTLGTTGAAGTAITWESDKPAVISGTGAVTRPPYTSGDASVKLTATITKGTASDTVVFNLTVLKNNQSDAEAVAEAKAALTWDVIRNANTTQTAVTTGLTLGTTGAAGTTITWTSDKTAVISNTGTMTRPPYASGDASVKLTATITKGTASDTVVFNLTVLKNAQSDAEAVAEAKAALTWEVIRNANTTQTAVTTGLTLGTTGAAGTTITWTSDKTAVISNTGTVTRPSYASGDASVKLTATISKGTASDSVVFNMTVLKNVQSDAEAVAEAKAALTWDVIRNANTLQSAIATDLTLGATGAAGTAISWVSDKTAVVSNTGTVTRPTYASGDASVKLTATISKGTASDTVVFNLTVLKNVQSDAEAVAEAKAALTWDVIRNANTAQNAVTTSLTLGTTGAAGTAITWVSDKTAVVSNTGTVTRPPYTSGDASVKLTATISKGTASDTVVFNLTVLKNAQSDAEAVAEAKAALTWEVIRNANTVQTAVTTGLTLGTTGAADTAITWVSDKTAVVSNAGTVTRPPYTSGDASVKLTATITKGAASDSVVFNLTVLKNPQSDAEAVAEAKAALTWDVIRNANTAQNSVTTGLTLGTTGAADTTITWASDKTAVISNTGAVTRPPYTSGDASVKLTATITKGTASDTVVFNLTVLKNAQSDAEAVAEAKAALTWDVIRNANTAQNAVTTGLTLGTTGAAGTAITWESDKPAVISGTGAVTRPLYTAGDASVKLTATISKGTASEQVVFNLNVLKNNQSDAEAVEAAKAALTWDIIKNLNTVQDAVTTSLNLITTGTAGTTISWESDKPAVISNTGAVTRPLYADGDANVKLTATIRKGAASETVVFNLTVQKMDDISAGIVSTELLISADNINEYCATVTVFNNTGTIASDISVIVAAYDVSDKLIHMASETATITEFDNKFFKVNLNVSGMNVSIIKAFLWNEYVPICPATVAEI